MRAASSWPIEGSLESDAAPVQAPGLASRVRRLGSLPRTGSDWGHRFADELGRLALLVQATHPLAFAGWLGMFVTALNLLPLGQLDGGHILYCLWEQPGQVRAARVFVAALVPLGAIWWGWWLWGGAALLVNRGRLRHPPVVQPLVPLTRTRALVARFTILIFFLTFVPVPLSV